jgi:hypothetical protein
MHWIRITPLWKYDILIWSDDDHIYRPAFDCRRMKNQTQARSYNRRSVWSVGPSHLNCPNCEHVAPHYKRYRGWSLWASTVILISSPVAYSSHTLHAPRHSDTVNSKPRSIELRHCLSFLLSFSDALTALSTAICELSSEKPCSSRNAAFTFSSPRSSSRSRTAEMDSRATDLFVFILSCQAGVPMSESLVAVSNADLRLLAARATAFSARSSTPLIVRNTISHQHTSRWVGLCNLLHQRHDLLEMGPGKVGGFSRY